MTFGRSRRAATVGLSGDSIADREIGKHSFCSTAGGSGRFQTNKVDSCTSPFPNRPVFGYAVGCDVRQETTGRGAMRC